MLSWETVLRTVVMGCITAIPLSMSAAELYKCVDEKGRVTFSQAMCPNDPQKMDVNLNQEVGNGLDPSKVDQQVQARMQSNQNIVTQRNRYIEAKQRHELEERRHQETIQAIRASGPKFYFR